VPLPDAIDELFDVQPVAVPAPAAAADDLDDLFASAPRLPPVVRSPESVAANAYLNATRPTEEEGRLIERRRFAESQLGPFASLVAGVGSSVGRTAKALGGMNSPMGRDLIAEADAETAASVQAEPGLWGDAQRAVGGLIGDVPLMVAAAPAGATAAVGARALGAGKFLAGATGALVAGQPLAVREGVLTGQEHGVGAGLRSWGIESAIPAAFGGTGAERVLLGAGRAASTGAKALAMRLLAEGGAEATEEVVTETAHAIDEYLSGRDDTFLDTDLGKRLALAAMVGGFAGGAFNAPDAFARAPQAPAAPVADAIPAGLGAGRDAFPPMAADQLPPEPAAAPAAIEPAPVADPVDLEAQLAAMFHQGGQERAPRTVVDQAGTAPIQAVKQADPSSVAAPTNAAPNAPAVPAPIPQTEPPAPELVDGTAVTVRAGKQFLDGKVLSTAADGRVNVQLADGRTLTNVPAFRVVPAKEKIDAGGGRPDRVGQGAAVDRAPDRVEPPRAPDVQAQRQPADAPLVVEGRPDQRPEGAADPTPRPVAVAPAPEPAPADAPRVATRVPVADGVPLGDAGALRARADAAARGELDQPKADPGEETRVERPAVKREAPPAPDATAVDTAAADANPAPTEAQKEAGNYAKGHVKLHGLDIAIENAKGSTRSGTGPGGKTWSVTMPAHYGYVKRTEGADGDQVDVYIGQTPEADRVWVVDQIDAETKKFDEHKVMVGFPDQDAALEAYDAAFSDGRGPARRGAVTPLPVEAFKQWLTKGSKKPIAYRAPRAAKPATAVAAAPAAPAEPPADDGFMPRDKDPAIRDQEKLPLEGPPADAPIQDFGEKIGGARKDTAEKGVAKPKRAKPQDERPAWARRYQIGEIVSSSTPGEKGRWSITDTKDTDWRGQAKQKGPTFATREEAEAAIPLLAVLRNHSVRQQRADDKWAIVRDVTDRKRVIIKGGFATEQAAKEYLALHAVEVIETETGYGEEILAKPDSVKRAGPERRKGDVGPKDFSQAFGFRGVEFGNWNNQVERQEVMNHAFDALMDLAEIVGVQPKAISLNGELALAFGARGHGLQGARAHYEHDHAVINLTKMKGAGALAHEWWHALDHYLGRIDGKASSERVDVAGGGKVLKAKGAGADMVSHGFRYNSKARPELIEAHKRLMETIHRKAEKFVEDTQAAEKFVGRSRDEVATTLRNVRAHIAKVREWGKKKDAASPEQLARFDAAADRLLNGEDRDTKLGNDFVRSNASIDHISAILKEVTGRKGRNAEHTGDLDRLAVQVSHYAARMKMLEDARAETPKEKKLPTQFVRDAKEIDQGRASDYWTTEHELVARAFSAFVEDKLADKSGASEFLSFGSDNWRYTLHGIRPFPEGDERKAMNAAFTNFLGAVKTEETADGNVRLYAPERTPGDDAPLEMPNPKEGIESLIAWSLRQREAAIEDLKQLVARGGSMVEEARADLAEHEAISAEDLARDMREFPQHYLRLMTERGGNMTAIGVYRNRVQLPPQQPRVQVAPLPLGDDEAPDLRATLRTLRDDLKVAAPSAPTFDVDRGALPGTAGGSFDPRTGAITTRHHNDLDLVAHEVGHWASESYGLLPDASDTETRAELARFAVHGTKARGDTAQREGMAEFIRGWMVDPATTETRAPRFAQRMREKLPPDVVAALRAYGDAARRFEGATALQKMAAGQQRTTAAIAQQKRDGRWYTPLWQGIKEFLGKGIGEVRARAAAVPDKWTAPAGTRAKYHLSDKEAPQLANYLMSLTLVGLDPATMKPSEHWDFLRRGARGVAAKVRDGIMQTGLPNIDGTAAKDPQTGEVMAMPWLLGPAPKDAAGFGAFLDKAHAYGSAQRTLELAERFENRVENEISAFAEAQVKGTGGDRLRMESAERATRAFAEERRRILRQQLARLTAAGGGLRSATEVARDAVAEMQSDPQRAEVEEYLRRYRTWADWNLRYAVESELMSPTQAETIRQANQFYIDWHRVFADDDGPVNLGEAVQGSSRTMHNPMASLMHATWSTIARGDRNRAALAFVAPLRMSPKNATATSLGQLGRQISQEAADEAATKHHGYHDGGAGEKHRVYHTQRVVQETNDDGSPVMGPDGEPLEQVVVEHWIFDAATEASMEAMRADGGDDPWAKINQGLVNLQRLAITSAPGFRFKVPVRDNIDRILNTEAGSGIADAARGLGKTLTDPLTGEELDLDRLYTQSGAGMAGWNRRTREQAMADVFAHVEDMRKNGYRWLTPGGAWRAWQAFGETTENIARKAEFVAAFKKGRTQLGYSQLDASLYAMTQARGLLDTAESGRTIGRLNRFFLFLNAATKGLERMTKISRAAAKAYRRGDLATGNRLAAVMAVRTAVWGTSLAALRLATLAMSDDDDQEELISAPAWKRDFSITVPDLGLGKIAIAKPYEWGFIGSGFERLADALWATGRAESARAAGDEEAAKRWTEHADRSHEGWGRSGMTAILPLKFDDVLGGGLAPIVEVAFNRSLFTGGTIIPGHEAEKRLALRAKADDASLIGRGISAVASPLLGERFGDPRAIDHLIRGYLGGWGTTATAKDAGEVMRRFTGYSGETSPYAERDVRWVLDWSTKEGVSSRKPFARLRELAKAAGDAAPADQDAALEAMRRSAQGLRRTIEANPRAFGAKAAASD